MSNRAIPGPYDDDFNGELTEYNVGLTPGEACRQLDLEVDELWHLVLDGAYGRYLPEEARCWPTLFDFDRIQELKADPDLVAKYRTGGPADLIERLELGGICAPVPRN